jgi:hypothetical protein
MQALIATVVIFALVGYIFNFIFLQTGNDPEIKVDGIVLRPVKTFFYGGLVALFIAIAIWGLMFMEMSKDNSVVPVAFISTFFLITGAYLVLYSKRYSVFASEEKIIQTNIMTKSVEILWSDVVDLKFNHSGSMVLTLKTKESKVDIDIFMYGFDRFADIMKRNIPAELSGDFDRGMDKLRSNRPDIFSK